MTDFTLTDSTGTVYTLSMPNWEGEKRSVNKNVVAMDFWDNTFEVFDKGLNAEPVSLYGVELSTVTESTATGYFDSYDEGGEEWTLQPWKMTDGDESTVAISVANNDTQLLLSHTITNITSGKISKVEIRAKVRSQFLVDTPYYTLQPIFTDGNGDNHSWNISDTALTWTDWYDITNDTNAPTFWTWNDVKELNANMISVNGSTRCWCMCSIVQIRVTCINYTTTKIEAIDSLADYNREVTIDGLGDCYDGVYVMTSFTYKTMKGTNQALEWEMELQHVRD
jgi:hypothetical protein